MNRAVVLVPFLLTLLLLGLPAAGQAPAKITIDPSQRFQTIAGFGVNFNGTYYRDAQKKMLDMSIARKRI